MNGNTHVPDKVEAFLLQVRHALYELIQATDVNCMVSVEAYDDVAIDNNGTIIPMQLKSVLSDDNPLSNRSVSFWKTLYNWCNYIENEHLEAKELKLVVVTQHHFKPGVICSAFNDAVNRCEAETALQTAFDLLQQTAKGKSIVSEECLPYVKYCFDNKNREIMLHVIELFSLDLHNGTYDETLKQKFYNQPIPPEYSDVLFLTMLGWVQECVHKATKANQPAFISKKEYNDALIKEIRGRDLNTILTALVTRPDSLMTSSEIRKCDTYIRQLELIDAEAEEICSAAADYLSACAEKIEWAKRGLVTEGSFVNYYDELIRNWNSNKKIIGLTQINLRDYKKIGQLIYYNCKKDAATVRLQGCVVPPFFGSGTLQMLANEPSDAPKIGWHPKYKDLLNNKEG
ncbi:MAG: hypothetical protein IJ601_02670 [Acidaminococcaceae bacterium]|nr:hypothetical protein [Acidaminococcaceae bacterium]